MKDKVLTKTRIGEYVPGAWQGENLSGVSPIGDQVLVLPDKASEQSKGGVWLPEHQRETHNIAAESGVIVAIGDGAWSWNMDRTRRFEGAKPNVGDRVCFIRYAGTEVVGDDGEIYRVMSDASICGIRSAKQVADQKAA